MTFGIGAHARSPSNVKPEVTLRNSVGTVFCLKSENIRNFITNLQICMMTMGPMVHAEPSKSTEQKQIPCTSKESIEKQ